MKDKLKELFESNKNNFSVFKEQANRQNVSSIWGMGAIPPYSILPFYSEILGNKPGKFLKKNSFPGKNKQHYILNSKNEIINSIEYSEYSEFNKQWIVYNKFYFHSSESIIEYSFGSALENDTNVNLDSIKLAQLENGIIVRGGVLRETDEYEYEELEYESKDGNINFIKHKNWWANVYFERAYSIIYNDNISIYEISDKGNIKIFP